MGSLPRSKRFSRSGLVCPRKVMLAQIWPYNWWLGLTREDESRMWDQSMIFGYGPRICLGKEYLRQLFDDWPEDGFDWTPNVSCDIGDEIYMDRDSWHTQPLGRRNEAFRFRPHPSIERQVRVETRTQDVTNTFIISYRLSCIISRCVTVYNIQYASNSFIKAN